METALTRRREIFALILTGLLLLGATGPGADPAPLPTDPAIESLVGMVSADSLEAYVNTMADFFTRHANSDTTSPTQGIGAARNWVHSKFESHAETSALEPGFFDFEEEICSMPNLHRNVVARLPGATSPERVFIVGGHMDSRTTGACDPTSFAPGANDDGTGVACAIELSRILSAITTDNTVIFQAFTAEEQGLVGSGKYAEFAAFSGMQVEGMLNNDMIGNIEGCPGIPDCDNGPPTDVDSTSVRIFSGEPATGGSRQLSRLARLMAEAYVPEMTVHLIPLLDRQGRGGDHIPFHEIGFSSLRFIETLEYTLRQHSANDQPHWINWDYAARNVKINMALLANLALAPAAPGDVRVFDVGTGGSIQVTWSSPQSLGGDLAGHRVAYRFVDQGDTLFYADIIDAGTDTSLAITGLTDDVTLAVSVSSYDMDNHESVFSPEKLVTPGVAPHAPQGFTVSSQEDRIRLDWSPPQELDLAGFRIERSLNEDSGFAVIDSVGADVVSYVDTDVVTGIFYYYRLSSVDVDGFESPPTAPDKGRLAEHQYGLLIVDASRDGGGGPGQPSDEQIDTYYAGIFDGVPILSSWDWIEQHDENGVLLTDADMSLFKTVFIHSDRNMGTISADTTEIRQYLDNGGEVWISGWEMKRSLGGIEDQLGTWGPESFMQQVMHVDSLRTGDPSEQDLAGVLPLEPGYPELATDSVKWPFGGGNLFGQDGHVGDPLDMPLTVPLYTYNSVLGEDGSNNGRINALKYPAGDPKLFFTDFPLYFMDSTSVRALAEVVLTELGYDVSAAPEAEIGRSVLLLQNHPNPFHSTAKISFYLPRAEKVSLRVLDVSGRVVRTLVGGGIEPGWKRLEWDGRDGAGHEAASGVYFYVLETQETKLVRRMTILR